MNYYIRKFLIIFTSLFFFGCSKKSDSLNGKINIIAASFPCYDAARAVAGDFLNDNTIALKLLIKPGMEIHSFDPTPQDLIALKKCDIFIYTGGESDEWIEKLIENGEFNSKAKIVKLFDIDSLKFVDEPDGLEENSSHNEKSEENPNETDEHIWTNPKNELAIVSAVSEAMQNSAAEKNLTEIIDSLKANENNYLEKINEVISETEQILKNSKNSTIVMADRFPFVYFADFYGLEYVSAFSGCSTAVEASMKTISKLIDTVKSKNLSAVFYIELGNHKIADSVAESCNVQALELQSCQNISKIDFENGETWVSLMKRNADALKKGLN